MIDTKFLKVDVVGETAKPDVVEAYAHAAEWCNSNNARIVEDGDYFVVVEIPAPPPPTPEEIQKQLTDAVQKHLDDEAKKLGYDSCLSVCSYIETGNPKFDAEGIGFRAWRSAVWAKCYEILDEVVEGKRPIPTADDLIKELPELEIIYPNDKAV